MRELMREHRITARSIPEVTGEMEAQISRYGMGRRVKFRGRKLSNEAFINAALLHVLHLPAAEQERAIAGAIAKLEAILTEEGAGSADGHPPGRVEVTEGATLREVHVPPAPAPQRKRKPAG